MTDPVSVLERIPYGVYAIVSLEDGRPHAIVATWLSQVSFQPPLVAAAIERESRMRQSIEDSGVFSVNMMDRDNITLAKNVLRSAVPGAVSAEELFAISDTGIPVLQGSMGSLECRVLKTVVTGDHVTFVGEVIGARGAASGEPILLRDTGWRYRRPKGESSWQP